MTKKRLMALCVSVQGAVVGFSVHRGMAASAHGPPGVASPGYAPGIALSLSDPAPAPPPLDSQEDQVREAFPETFLFSVQTLE